MLKKFLMFVFINLIILSGICTGIMYSQKNIEFQNSSISISNTLVADDIEEKTLSENVMAVLISQAAVKEMDIENFLPKHLNQAIHLTHLVYHLKTKNHCYQYLEN